MTAAQFFLGDPQGWKGPQIAYAGGTAGLKADAAEAGIRLYVHAPYVINVATTNNRIRIPSRKLLQQHADAAAEIDSWPRPPLPPPVEQRHAQPVLQQLDLIADAGLRHPQFRRGGGEGQVPGHRLEDADGGERGKGFHKWSLWRRAGG